MSYTEHKLGFPTHRVPSRPEAHHPGGHELREVRRCLIRRARHRLVALIRRGVSRHSQG